MSDPKRERPPASDNAGRAPVDLLGGFDHLKYYRKRPFPATLISRPILSEDGHWQGLEVARE